MNFPIPGKSRYRDDIQLSCKSFSGSNREREVGGNFFPMGFGLCSHHTSAHGANTTCANTHAFSIDVFCLEIRILPSQCRNIAMTS